MERSGGACPFRRGLPQIIASFPPCDSGKEAILKIAGAGNNSNGEGISSGLKFPDALNFCARETKCGPPS